MKRYFTTKNIQADPSSSSKKPPMLSLSQLFVAGAASGMANSILSGPIEHVRIRLQSDPSKTYTGPIDFMKKVGSSHGIAGIYKGQGITLVRELGGYGIYFATYEALMQRTMALEGKRRADVEAWKQVTYGAVAGYLLW